MADMAPALTGAAQEAPHRLKLSAPSSAWKPRSGLLLLNGGEKSRLARERPEYVLGPGEEEEERPLHGLQLMERLEEVPGPRGKAEAGPGPLRKAEAGPGPLRKEETVPGPKRKPGAGPPGRPEQAGGLSERLGAAPGPRVRLEGVSGAPTFLPSALGPSVLRGSGPITHPTPGMSIHRGSASGPVTHSAPGPSVLSSSGPSVSSALLNSGAGPLALQNSVLGPQKGQEDVLDRYAAGPTGGLEMVPGPPARQDLVGSQVAAPTGGVPQFSGAISSMPGPRVSCALRAAQMSSRQQELGARARRLCRRLQVIQAKQVERHVRQQLSGLVELLSERGAAGLPGAPQVELDRLASSSTARLRAAQGGFDSDATESSSGGESDEEETAESVEERLEERCTAAGSDRRAEWRWAVERAAIICRWTWLQAQVSDLEFRIRQQTEIYKQIRCTKGSVVLGDPAHCEDSVVLNARGTPRVPSSSCVQTAPRGPSGDDVCDRLSSTPNPSPHSSDKQCSRLVPSAENVVCPNTPTTSVCDSSGSQKPARQVNGLINCVRSTLSCNGSAEDLDPEEVLGKKRRVDALSTSPALSDSTCVAARTRPLRGHKKRSLVRSSDVSSLSRKPQKPPTAKCGCQPPTTCILCGCKTYAKAAHLSTLSLCERLALMDPCYHPILSFPYDTPLHLHFEALLKEDRQFRLSNKLKILKLSQLSSRAQDTGSFAHVRGDQEQLVQYHVENWQKNRLLSDGTADRTRSPFQRPSSNPAFSGSLFRDDRQYKGLSSPSIHASSPVTPRPVSTAHQLCPLTEIPASSSLSLQNSASAAVKRKRFENSYDIDNIVIPMSLVAASRVEKLQYKEILTPSWCVLDSADTDFPDVDPQLEDTSDEVYQDRHSKYEELERSRWDSWTSATPQRRGSRSSNKSDGRWTPQPTSSSLPGSQQALSPDIRFHSLNDIPLSLTSDSLEPYSTVQCLSVHSRTRVLSWSEDTQSSTPEFPDEEEQVCSGQTVQPFELRSFPLSDRDCRALQDSPGTPSKGRAKPVPDVSWQPSAKPVPDVSWQPSAKPAAQTDSIDSGMSTENLTPASKDSPLLNSISVVRVRSHSGEKIASLEYLPARPVNKR